MFSWEYTDIDTSLSVYLQFYLCSGYESSLFSCEYIDIDTSLSVYLQFYLFSGYESSLFSCEYTNIDNCDEYEAAGVECI